jgi:hypothetical protein
MLRSSTGLIFLAAVLSPAAGGTIDFSTQIRPILSENCFFCHGPDDKKREAGLRLDEEAAAKADNDGVTAVVPGDPDASALIQRITSTDPDDVMPPPKLHKVIPSPQIELLKEWIREGAGWGGHWSYARVERPEIPGGVSHPVDAFLLRRLKDEGLEYSQKVPAEALVRRVALDLTGLPPKLQELDQLASQSADAIIDHYLGQPSYGEHWAQMWLDLARYADSSGYPSDQPREIWAYRDWVIDAFNRNLPFDQFTVEQLAGDLLPKPGDEELIATAFHRNTMTQNEGGTSDEEFRVAAIVDRVNTTMAVWMGTTMACAQCHTHKYDPITIDEYYQFYDFLNQTADSDKKDESPVHSFFTVEQNKRRDAINSEIKDLDKVFANPGAKVLAGLQGWEQGLPVHASWSPLKPSEVASHAKATVSIDDDGRVNVAKPTAATDTLTVDLPIESGEVEAIRLEALADKELPGSGPGHANGNFVVSRVRAEWVPGGAEPVAARRLRLTKISDKYDFLALAEVEVFSGGRNVARKGTARQGSTFVGQPDEKPVASLAIDGNTDGNWSKGRSVSITAGGDDQWWELDLGQVQNIDRVVIHRRTDKGQGVSMKELDLTFWGEDNEVVWSERVQKASFAEVEEISISGRRTIALGKAYADATQKGFNAADVLAKVLDKGKGWAIAGHTGKDQSLTLLPAEPLSVEKPGHLRLVIEQGSKWEGHTLGAFRLSVADDARIGRLASLPPNVLQALSAEPSQRDANQARLIQSHYTQHVAPELKAERDRIIKLEKELAGIKAVTVPIMQKVGSDQRRESRIQLRGDWQSLGNAVTAATPAAFHPLPEKAERNRLTLARWLVDRDNPLTARVMVNRLWEAVFGVGIVSTSEEFGSQGELPFHPELLDWLAAEFMDSGWDIQHMLRLMLTSQAYQQDSRTTTELTERDPDNRLLARGPRFRPTGELLRDQSLAVSGLLSRKLGGPPVRPMAPKSGLKAAFGRANDWTTSEGEDRHRRSVYTEVRRNSPYASFMTFDGVNREVCTIRRNRTNTPLQAFVTLNDPVFIEANQALARRLLEVEGASVEDRVRLAFRRCLSRNPSPKETETLKGLLEDSLAQFRADHDAAKSMATDPLGPAPENADVVELAAWTAVANVIMNLDEFLTRR